MDDATSENEARFSAYVEALASVIGHVNRVDPLKDYCIGLILPGERKSVEPMAAVIAPTRASAERAWPGVTLTLPQIGARLLRHGSDNLGSYGWVCGRHEVAHEGR